jgi:hypothetical protein
MGNHLPGSSRGVGLPCPLLRAPVASNCPGASGASQGTHAASARPCSPCARPCSSVCLQTRPSSSSPPLRTRMPVSAAPSIGTVGDGDDLMLGRSSNRLGRSMRLVPCDLPCRPPPPPRALRLTGQGRVVARERGGPSVTRHLNQRSPAIPASSSMPPASRSDAWTPYMNLVSSSFFFWFTVGVV